jgi:hypothetical protein
MNLKSRLLYSNHTYFLGHKTRKPEGNKTMLIKKFPKVSYSVFEAAAKQLQMGEANLAEAIGYHRNAHNHWKKSGLMPKVASIAIECLLRRNNVSNKEAGTLVVKTNNGNLDAVKSILTALDCSFVEV